MKKKLIILSGSSWVGKTTVGKYIFEHYENSAYCDGDWCWCVNPFSVEDPRLRNGDKTMSFALSTYLNSDFEYVIFSTVVATDFEIRENILKDIEADDYEVLGFTLTCTKETLQKRHDKREGKGKGEVNLYFLNLPPYPTDTVIYTDDKSVAQIAQEICSIIDRH